MTTFEQYLPVFGPQVDQHTRLPHSHVVRRQPRGRHVDLLPGHAAAAAENICCINTKNISSDKKYFCRKNTTAHSCSGASPLLGVRVVAVEGAGGGDHDVGVPRVRAGGGGGGCEVPGAADPARPRGRDEDGGGGEVGPPLQRRVQRGARLGQQRLQRRDTVIIGHLETLDTVKCREVWL